MPDAHEGMWTHTDPREAADIVLLHRDSRDRWCVLLVERKFPPFKGMWAFPGGMVEDEEPIQAALRELFEETGLMTTRESLSLVGVYGEEGRDPRGPVTSHVFRVETQTALEKLMKAGDDARAVMSVPLEGLDTSRLAFDHAQILSDALYRVPSAFIIDVCCTCGAHAKWPFCRHRDEVGDGWCMPIRVVPTAGDRGRLAEMMHGRARRNVG